MGKIAKILAVDDEEFNRDILTEYLEAEDFEVIQADDGDTALEMMGQHPDVDIVVLDRMMSRMNGLDVVKHLKKDDRFKHIPIIMQTAAASSQHVIEGISAGVYYYLIKPYKEDTLIAIVKAALSNCKNRKDLLDEVKKHNQIVGLMEKSQFRFRTLEEAKGLSHYMASCFPEPEKVVYGLNELLINAIEHGNLGITYDEKSKLMLQGKWLDEVTTRLNLKENQDKFATLTFENTGDTITLHIKDQGKGFDWQEYLELSPKRATDLHGRGIATSRLMSFHDIQYLGKGNEVLCTMLLC